MDVSQITEYLFVAAHPQPDDAGAIRNLGVRLVISMVAFRRPPAEFDKPPLRLLWLKTFDSVFFPIPLRTLQRGVEEALPIIREGYGVLVFCMYGRHRSVAMAAAILIGLGHPAEEAMRMLIQARAVADPRAPHIRRQVVRFERHWQRTHPDIPQKG